MSQDACLPNLHLRGQSMEYCLAFWLGIGSTHTLVTHHVFSLPSPPLSSFFKTVASAHALGGHPGGLT